MKTQIEVIYCEGDELTASSFQGALLQTILYAKNMHSFVLCRNTCKAMCLTSFKKEQFYVFLSSNKPRISRILMDWEAMHEFYVREKNMWHNWKYYVSNFSMFNIFQRQLAWTVFLNKKKGDGTLFSSQEGRKLPGALVSRLFTTYPLVISGSTAGGMPIKWWFCPSIGLH